MLEYLSPSKAFRSKISCCAIARLKKPPSGGSNSGAASASPPSRFERLTSLKPPALPGDIYFSQPKPTATRRLQPPFGFGLKQNWVTT